MDTCSGMDLVTLLARVPPLLKCCILEHHTNFRALRLVSKAASQVAPLGLSSFYLSFQGLAKETYGGASRMLKNTQLTEFTLSMQLSDSFSPTALLESFVSEAGSCLRTVRSLSLHLADTSSNPIAAAELREAISLLVGSCPILLSLQSDSHRILSSSFLARLGGACRLLTELRITGGGEDLAHLQGVIHLLPLLLPTVTCLQMRFGTKHQLPNMVGNTGITKLELLGYTFETWHPWLSLPPKLTHLICYKIEAGPPPSTPGISVLSSLESVQLEYSTPLHAVAQLLNGAPSLQSVFCMSDIDKENGTESEFLILLSLTTSTAAELQALVQHPKFGVIKRHKCFIECQLHAYHSSASLKSFVASKPVLRGVTSVYLMSWEGVKLSALLHVFPDVTDLSLQAEGFMGGVELQAVAACKKLVKLELSRCDEVHSDSMEKLFSKLPALRKVHCYICEHMEECDVAHCDGMLNKSRLPVKVTGVHVID